MNTWDNKDKTFIVTGASSGIGRSCAESLLKSGASVIGIDLGEGSISDPLYMHCKVSVTDEEAVEAVEAVVSGVGKIDGLVNVAGIWGNSKAAAITSNVGR